MYFTIRIPKWLWRYYNTKANEAKAQKHVALEITNKRLSNSIKKERMILVRISFSIFFTKEKNNTKKYKYKKEREKTPPSLSLTYFHTYYSYYLTMEFY